MSVRAIALGLFLAIFISCFTYFNDAVIRSTFLIGNFLPIGIFGLVVVILLGLNPLLRAIRPEWPMRPAEIAIATALGLAACGWPGSNFYRTAVFNVAMPPHLEQTQTGWQGQNVMSYVPGGSPSLAQGQVYDWQRLAAKIAEADPSQTTPASRIHQLLEPGERFVFTSAATAALVEPAQVNAMTRALNRLLGSPQLYAPEAFAEVEFDETIRRQLTQHPEELSEWRILRLNRGLLVAAFPDLVAPPPAGQGVLLSFDRPGREVMNTLLEGRPEEERWSIFELPWEVWWPNIRLWGGLSILLGLAALCMALIVHPQWYKRELLPYPLARFVSEATARESGAWLPSIARNKMFWVALVIVFGLRLLNGFAAWFEAVPEFPLIYGFNALRVLFPIAHRVPVTYGSWEFRLFPTVIAFTFFLNTKVAFSLGMANFAWIFFGWILLSRGIRVGSDWIGADVINLVRFGSFLGMALMLFYTGRRYYSNVALSTFGLTPGKETPPYAVWAGRGLLLCFVLATALLTTAGLPTLWAILFLLLVLLIFLVLSRVVAETGAFFLQTSWMPVGILTAMFGFEAIGPTAYIVMGVASIMIVGDPRTALMPFLSTGLRIGEETGETRPARLSPWLAGVLVGGFLLAGAVTLYFQHNKGVNIHDSWAMRHLPSLPFSELARQTTELSGRGILSEATLQPTMSRLTSMFSPVEGAYFWLILGAGLVLVTAFARLRLPWWPLHPVLFLVWATYPIQRFGGAFLVGWAIKAAVVKTMGAKGYHSVMPLMIGLIAGDLLGGLLWIVIGVLYYFATGLQPAAYPIFPT